MVDIFRNVPLFSAPFRPFFLAAAAHAAIAILAWAAFLLHGIMVADVRSDPFLWHGHTMIAGFAGAVIAGFLLTASGNWTGRPTTTPRVLALLVFFWLLGRLGDYVPALPPLVGAIADGIFWLGTVGLVLRVILLSRNWRNLGFGLLPLAFGIVDLLWHLDHTGLTTGTARPALWTGVDLLTVIMGAMGGRIIPFFTDRRLLTVRIYNPAWLAIAANVALIATIPANWLFRGETTAAGIMIVAGVLLLARLAGWNSLATRREPMLWILHLGYAWLGVALILRATAIYTDAFPETTALHAVTTGALGALGLGMLARVALGHTGRAMRAERPLIAAFALITLAAVTRLTPMAAAPAWLAFGLSSFFWGVAFALYFRAFAPILTAPRA